MSLDRQTSATPDYERLGMHGTARHSTAAASISTRFDIDARYIENISHQQSSTSRHIARHAALKSPFAITIATPSIGVWFPEKMLLLSRQSHEKPTSASQSHENRPPGENHTMTGANKRTSVKCVALHTAPVCTRKMKNGRSDCISQRSHTITG